MTFLVSPPRTVIKNDRRDPPAPPLAELSEAERAVFDLARQGLSNKEIAAARGRSLATVKNQLQAVFQKLDVPGRCRLIAWHRDATPRFGP
jgi:DNA-binding NarL/FixJ family response regulator